MERITKNRVQATFFFNFTPATVLSYCLGCRVHGELIPLTLLLNIALLSPHKKQWAKKNTKHWPNPFLFKSLILWSQTSWRDSLAPRHRVFFPILTSLCYAQLTAPPMQYLLSVKMSIFLLKNVGGKLMVFFHLLKKRAWLENNEM